MIDFKTPELDKIKDVQEASQIIGTFLDTMEYELGYWEDDEFVPVEGSIEEVLADYFGIDLQKVEEERRMILEHLQNLQSL